ncbi:MAG: PilZ domain-containing protein [Anaerolineales bacterium]|nr:PilZ domain-containing protein [Anaerolineales bacterium]
MESERRAAKRKRFTYYMRVMDANSLQLIGYLTQISAVGIQVDSEKPLPVNTNFKLRVDLTTDIANKTMMIFNGRSKWCQPDPAEPNSFNVGFEVTLLSREDTEIFNRMIEKYATESSW